MSPLPTKENPIDSNLPLEAKVKKTDPVQAQIIAEYKKENLRLQKLYAKMLVKKDSEIAGLKSQLAEAKKESHLKITRVIISPDDANL